MKDIKIEEQIQELCNDITIHMKFQRKEEQREQLINDKIFSGEIKCSLGEFEENCKLDMQLQETFDLLLKDKQSELQHLMSLK